MADEFSTAAVCGGGGWWNPTRNMLGSSLCSASMNDIGNFAWQNHDGEVVGVRGRPNDPSEYDISWQENERGERNYGSMLQEDLNSSLNYGQETSNANGDFSCSLTNSSSQELSTTFPINSYNTYPQNLLKSMFDTDPQPQPEPHQQCLIGSFAPPPTAVPPTVTKNNYGQNLCDFSPSPTKLSSLLNPTNHHLQFPSTISLWNSSSDTSLNDVRSCFFPPPTFSADKKSIITGKSNDSSCLANKTSNEPEFKRPRIETPSPLPTFKVRKEKLGDRVTALQQLVSPFGKTDTASVLHEAIECIKFLHDQVNVLITPYMKNASPSDQHCHSSTEKLLDKEGLQKQDLRSRGLCLVPMSSTFPVAAETATDFWTPTFGTNFR